MGGGDDGGMGVGVWVWVWVGVGVGGGGSGELLHVQIQIQTHCYFNGDYIKRITLWLEFLLSLCRLLPYPFVCCIEILCTISLFIYRLFWCSQQGISVVGASHRRTWRVVLVYYKVMYTKSYLSQTTDPFIQNRRSSQPKISPSQERTGYRSGVPNQQFLH